MEQIPKSTQQPPPSPHALMFHPDIVQIRERFECKMSNMQQQAVTMIQDMFGFFADEIALVTVKMLAAQRTIYVQKPFAPQQQQRNPDPQSLSSTPKQPQPQPKSQAKQAPTKNSSMPNRTTSVTSKNVSTNPKIRINRIVRLQTPIVVSDHNYAGDIISPPLTSNRLVPVTPDVARAAFDKSTNGDNNVDHHQNNNKDNNNNNNNNRTLSEKSAQFETTMIEDSQRENISHTPNSIQNGNNTSATTTTTQPEIEILNIEDDEDEDNDICEDRQDMITRDIDYRNDDDDYNNNFDTSKFLNVQIEEVTPNDVDRYRQVVYVDNFNFDESIREESSEQISMQTQAQAQQAIDGATGIATVAKKRRRRSRLTSNDGRASKRFLAANTTLKSDQAESGEIQVPKSGGEDIDDNEYDEKTLRYGIKTVSLRCDIDGCEYVIAGKSALLRHQREAHGVRPVRCRICEPIISFENKQDLLQHIESVHASGNAYGCERCARTFGTYHSFKTHVYHYHETGIFRCSAKDCSFEHTIRDNVFRHIRNKHIKHVCAFTGCGQSFYGKGPLRRHERIHLQVRPYTCAYSDDCNYASTQRGAVMQHIRSVHFHLPRSEKKQRELNIIDQRDLSVYLRVDEDLLRMTMDSAPDPNQT